MENEFEDRELECVDCHNSFTFGTGEQEFFNKKGLSDPKRCVDCRRKKKLQKENTGPGPQAIQ
ncbi:MAG: zinc-ribbon domain containing protein [Minisyncoccia bacterium]